MFSVLFTIHRNGAPYMEIREKFSTRHLKSWDDFFAAVQKGPIDYERPLVLDNVGLETIEETKKIDFDRIKEMDITLMFSFVFHEQ